MAYITGTACSCMRLDPQAMYYNRSAFGKSINQFCSIFSIFCFYDLVLSRLGFELPTFRLRGERSSPKRHRRGLSLLRYEMKKLFFLNKGYLQENEMWIGTCGTIRFASVDDPENYFQWTPTMTVDLQ